MLESRPNLDLAFTIKQDLAAANIIMSETLIVHVVKGPENLFG